MLTSEEKIAATKLATGFATSTIAGALLPPVPRTLRNFGLGAMSGFGSYSIISAGVWAYNSRLNSSDGLLDATIDLVIGVVASGVAIKKLPPMPRTPRNVGLSLMSAIGSYLTLSGGLYLWDSRVSPLL